MPRRALRYVLRHAAGLAILILFLFAGEAAASVVALPIPGSVLGMILLVAALQTGIVRLSWVRPFADLLLRHMALFFVPPGVALMLYFDLVAAEWLPILVAGAASTVVVMLTVGLIHQRLEPDD